MSSTPLLEGKVAVITGASRGIGAATARAFSAAGASVALAARDQAALAALARVRDHQPRCQQRRQDADAGDSRRRDLYPRSGAAASLLPAGRAAKHD